MGWFGGSGRLAQEDARRIWYARQGLASRRAWSGSECLSETGWLRSLGGNAYLSCRARVAAFDRELLEGQVFESDEIENVPSVRSCVMLVPTEDIEISLAAARPGIQKDVARVVARCGVSIDEVEQLARDVVRALEAGPMTSDQLRRAMPSESIQSLGEVGRKLGDSSTLSLALRLATAAGKVRRLPDKGRLDQSKILYGTARPRPQSDLELTDEVVARELIRRYFRWAAPARISECARWTGLAKAVVKEVLLVLGAREVPVEGHRYYALPDDEFLAKKAKVNQPIAFLPADDNLAGLRGSLEVLLPDRTKDVVVAGKRIADLRILRYHQIFDEGALVGLWEFDPDQKRVAWGCFGKVAKARLRLIEEEAKSVYGFVSEVLGDLKMSSIDTKKHRDTRIVAIDGLTA